MVSARNGLPPKLSRPSAGGLAPRERLFALLDRFRRRPITWIEGPPGAGKTSLVSSWIEARGLQCLWYQVDAGDADPATFFHYLGSAAPRNGAPLSPLTPEYLPDLSGFARRFFRALHERLPGLAVIVLDNFQDVPEGAPLASLVREGVAQLPEAVTLVALSRADPPPAFAEAIARADLARLGWDDLRLDLAETGCVAGLEGLGADERARVLLERSGGWAAGLRLMVSSTKSGAAWQGTPVAPESLFEYLATEVFDRSTQTLRELWLATAYLPRFTAETAAALAGRDDASEQLESLAGQRYFIDRRPGKPATYQYHALFGQFLRRQVERYRDEAARRTLAHRSAALLAASGETEAAFRLYCTVGEFGAAIPLLLGEAPALLAQGRWQTLEAALAALPAALLDDVPWLGFWRGAAQSMVNPPLGRASLERAYARFVAAGDAAGQAMSVAAVIEGYFAEWDHLAMLSPWIEAAEKLSGAALTFPSPAAELRFRSSLLIALAHCRPASPLGPAVADRVFDLLGLDLGANEKLAAGSHLVQYFAIAGDGHRAASVLALLEPLLDRPDVAPLIRVSMLWAATMQAHYAGDSARALRANLEAQRIIREHGFVFAAAITRLFEVWTRADAGDFEAASALLDEIAPIVARARPNELALSHFLRSWFALRRGEHAQALAEAELALQGIAGRETYGPTMMCNGALALAAFACGDPERSRAAIERMHACAPGLERGALRLFGLLVEADILIRSGSREEGRKLLREAFSSGRRADSIAAGLWLPDVLARLCAEALESGIEPDYAKRLVARRGLHAPSLDVAAWPWPIRVRTLGGFEVAVGGEVLRFGRKAQRRVLDLLKCVVALGPQGVSRDAVAGTLWPDSEGDAARDAFEITLHRLRKLLGRDDAVVLSNGMLHLNPAITWTDAVAFERLAGQAAGDRGDVGLAAAERALALYRGPFLGNEEEAPWLLPARARLRSRYLRLATLVAQRREQAGDGAGAADVYARALELEPFTEDLYRRLMLCLAAQDRRAESLDVYRRCQQMLSVVLGTTPSAETEAIHAKLKART
jgi:ATP/maltotriose-dependent transcriptional regulator MalT/DNA-binding SARP family transcriptional activator